MEIEDAIETAEKHERIKELKEEGGFLCSAYVLLDPGEEVERWNLSYYDPDDDEITLIEIGDGKAELGETDEPFRDKDLQPFEELPDVGWREALDTAREKEEEMDVNTLKIIVSLQKNGEEFWSVTFLGRGGVALNVKVDTGSGEVLETEKSSLLSIGE